MRTISKRRTFSAADRYMHKAEVDMSNTEYALGAHCGITFAGIKAGSLINIKRECMGCIRRYVRYFGRRGFKFVVLRQGSRVLLYVYNCKKLGEILSDSDIRTFLRGHGYIYDTAEEAVAILKSRMGGGEFPHEIGIFLDYPLEDVQGFISRPCEGIFTGHWKVYADEEGKRKLFEKFDRCTRKIISRMRDGCSLESIFNADLNSRVLKA